MHSHHLVCSSWCPCYRFAVALAIRTLSRGRHSCPALSDLVALEAPQHEASKLHSLFRSSVGPTPDIAAHDLVTLGDHVLDGHVKVGHFLVHPEHHLEIALDTGWLPAGPVVIVEISGQVLADHVGVSLVYKFLELMAHELLHLLQAETGMPLPSPRVRRSGGRLCQEAGLTPLRSCASGRL